MRSNMSISSTVERTIEGNKIKDNHLRLAVFVSVILLNADQTSLPSKLCFPIVCYCTWKTLSWKSNNCHTFMSVQKKTCTENIVKIQWKIAVP